ncbi:MAG: helix-turn-helix transcriptional regulator [Oscillospiraceae bacterium]|jgi:transcriptional regulator with XRE-family HTH domain|nr:helix-turn-helix transcriptional regulator [Oscillospiraceae bacterium]
MVFERIRNIREDRDIRQRQVAEYLNVSQNTYSQYENGVISLSAETAVRLAEFYGTSVDYLLGLTDEKKPYKRR